MTEKCVIFECDLCFNETDTNNQGLSNYIYGIRGCDIDHISRQVQITLYPRQEHEYSDVNGKEIHLCHACLEMLCEEFAKIDKYGWDSL